LDFSSRGHRSSITIFHRKVTKPVSTKQAPPTMIKYLTLGILCAFLSSKIFGDAPSVDLDDITGIYKIIKSGKLYKPETSVKLNVSPEKYVYPDDIIYTNGNSIVIEGRGAEAFEQVMSLEAGGQSLTTGELISDVLPLFNCYSENSTSMIIDRNYLKWVTNDSDREVIKRLESFVSTPKAISSGTEWTLDYYVVSFFNRSASVVHYIVRGEQKTFRIREISCVYLKDKFDIPPRDT
jgi:hypothetical protein